MMKLVYNLPQGLKIKLGRIQTLFDHKKRRAIKLLQQSISNDYSTINSPIYKESLKRFFIDCLWSNKEIEEYINYLYNDDIVLINEGNWNETLPTIISVVKNESNKLNVFFDHYNKLGQFNYIFIDNNSSDNSVDIIMQNGGRVYSCKEQFSTNRKLSWINKIYSTIPDYSWTILLDADELLVFHGYEGIPFNTLMGWFDKEKIDLAGAVMIDMFSRQPASEEDYLSKYVYFENNYHLEKSVFCNSVYGGIRERAFGNSNLKFSSGRAFLVKKHPVIKKIPGTQLIHCHYIYPFKRNYKSKLLFGLLHYKLFDKELQKYRTIADNGSYGGGSVEYKSYLASFQSKEYEDIFSISDNTILYDGTNSLDRIKCIRDVRELHCMGGKYDKK